MHMNILDIAILTVLLIFTLRGAFKGLIGEIMGFVAVLLSLVLAVRWLNIGTSIVRSFVTLSPTLAMMISFILIFILVFWGTLMLARLFRKLLHITMLGWVDRLGGAAFGLLTGATIVSLLVMLLSLVPLSPEYQNLEQESVLFSPTRQFAPHLFNWVISVAPSAGDFYHEVSQAVSSKTEALNAPLQDFLKSVQKRTAGDSTLNEKQTP